MLRGLKWVNESYPQLSILIKRSIPRVVKNNSSWMIQRERDHLAEQRPGESARVGCQDGECLLIQEWKPGKWERGHVGWGRSCMGDSAARRHSSRPCPGLGAPTPRQQILSFLRWATEQLPRLPRMLRFHTVHQ